MNSLLTDIFTRIAVLLFAAPFAFFAYQRTKAVDIKYLFLVAGFFLLDRLWFSVPDIISTTSHLTWQGKVLSSLWSLVFIFFLSKLTATEFGLTKIFFPDTFKPFLRFTLIYSISLFLLLFFLHKKQQFSTEDILYQATMPGISEELLYRGIMLTYLNNVFVTKWKFMKTKIGWGFIIVTFIFALIHSLKINNIEALNISFDLSSFLWMLVPGFIFGYVKEWTGNLFASIITHNIWNVITTIGKSF